MRCLSGAIHLKVTYSPLSYHNGEGEDWGKYLHNVVGGRIVAVKLEPRSIDHEGDPAGKCQDPNAKPMVIPGINLHRLSGLKQDTILYQLDPDP